MVVTKTIEHDQQTMAMPSFNVLMLKQYSSKNKPIFIFTFSKNISHKFLFPFYFKIHSHVKEVVGWPLWITLKWKRDDPLPCPVILCFMVLIVGHISWLGCIFAISWYLIITSLFDSMLDMSISMLAGGWALPASLVLSLLPSLLLLSLLSPTPLLNVSSNLSSLSTSLPRSRLALVVWSPAFSFLSLTVNRWTSVIF